MRHYLDYNATAPVRPEVRVAMAEALEMPGNPSSVHAAGRAARAAVEDARARVAALVGADAADVVFTGSGTEANNLALFGPRPRRILASAIEHPSILRPAAERPGGFSLIPVGSDGVVDLAALEGALAENSNETGGPALVTIMAANNETGVLQPIKDVVRIARASGALVHCDAVQAVGRVPLDFQDLDVDLMSLSAHKIGGPKGVGALIKRAGLNLAPLITGGGQERGLRAGTENVPGIIGFGAAADLTRNDLEKGDEITRQRALRDRLEAMLEDCVPGVAVIGRDAPRVANTSCLAVPGDKAETLVIALDLAGIAVSAGSACSSGKVESSHVLSAMGLAPERASAAIRVSLGYDSTAADVDDFINTFRSLHDRNTQTGWPKVEKHTA